MMIWLLRRLTPILIFNGFINCFFYLVFYRIFFNCLWKSKLVLKSLLRSIPWLLFPCRLLIPIRLLNFWLFPSRLVPCLFNFRLLTYLFNICFFPSLLLNILLWKGFNPFNDYFVHRWRYIRSIIEICYLSKKKRVCIIRFLFLKFYLMLLKLINLRFFFDFLDRLLFFLLGILLLFYKWE